LDPDVGTFEKLWHSVTPHGETTNEEYFRLRSGLIKFFQWRRGESPEDLADETLARVIDRLENGEVTSNLATYCYSVAAGVWKEYLGTRKKMRLAAVELEDILSLRAPLAEDLNDDDTKHECLELCLQKLLPKDRALILQYYQKEKSAKIEQRIKLAKDLGTSVNGLRVRIFRIRERLERCITQCMEEKAQE
jgi:RNA polymerase sigma factor (sigma-70 family)